MGLWFGAHHRAFVAGAKAKKALTGLTRTAAFVIAATFSRIFATIDKARVP